MSEQIKTRRTKNWIQTSITFRMVIIGILILVLLIPLAFIKELIRERKSLQSQVVSEINANWGDEILLYGPILKIPYTTYSERTMTDSKTKKTQTIREKEIQYAYFFPDKLTIDGNINTEMKHKGMYTTSVYTTQSKLMGSFGNPDFKVLEIPDKNIIWGKAQIIMQTTNLKGIKDPLNINLADKNLSFESKFSNTSKNEGYYAKNGEYITTTKHDVVTKSFNYKKISKGKPISFSMDFNVSGSQQFRVIPIGKETTMHLTSNWKDAGFEGEYLPYNPDKIKDHGFDAHWKVLQMNRPFSQQFNYLPKLDEYAFGVNFFIPVDDYQQNERTAKYGYLVIALTFLLFFLIQTLSKIYIHPFQYLMIGLALIIFYTLLVSISEHSDFNQAYLIAGGSIIGLITLYSKSIMKTWRFPLFIGISLIALYSFIFVIIQLENYALLVGSIGLLLILAVVMFASRKIEWS